MGRATSGQFTNLSSKTNEAYAGVGPFALRGSATSPSRFYSTEIIRYDIKN